MRKKCKKLWFKIEGLWSNKFRELIEPFAVMDVFVLKYVIHNILEILISILTFFLLKIQISAVCLCVMCVCATHGSFAQLVMLSQTLPSVKILKRAKLIKTVPVYTCTCLEYLHVITQVVDFFPCFISMKWNCDL